MRQSASVSETLGYHVLARHLPLAGTAPKQPRANDSAQRALERVASKRRARRASKMALLAVEAIHPADCDALHNITI